MNPSRPPAQCVGRTVGEAPVDAALLGNQIYPTAAYRTQSRVWHVSLLTRERMIASVLTAVVLGGLFHVASRTTLFCDPGMARAQYLQCTGEKP